MKAIAANSQLFKKIVSLQYRKHREECGLFVVEGARGVQDALRMTDVVNVVLQASAVARYSNLIEQCQSVASNVRVASENNVVCTVQDRLFERISDTVHSQGIIAVVQKPYPRNIDSRYCLYLDRIQDPGNMGAVLRTARATGFDKIYVDNCVDVYNPKVVRSAASALFGLDVVPIVSDAACCNADGRVCAYKNTVVDCQHSSIQSEESGDKANTAESNGEYSQQADVAGQEKRYYASLCCIRQRYSIVCADVDGDSIFDCVLPQNNICLVVGNEGSGIQSSIMQHADYSVKLPMHNMQSLNVAVAAGVLMYNIVYRS